MADFNTSHTNSPSARKKGSYMIYCCGSDGYLSCEGCSGKCNMGNTYNADFNEAQNKVRRAEGGYSNDPRDRGNFTSGKLGVGTLIGTNWGISAPVLKAYMGKEPSVSDMKNLPYATAVKIYKSQYWAPIKGDQIKSQKVADMVYDAAVNSGPSAAQKFVKDSLGIAKYDIDKINSANPNVLFNKIGSARKKSYVAQGGYALPSWLDRLEKLGYAAKRHSGKAAMVALGFAMIISGVVVINKSQ